MFLRLLLHKQLILNYLQVFGLWIELIVFKLQFVYIVGFLSLFETVYFVLALLPVHRFYILINLLIQFPLHNLNLTEIDDVHYLITLFYEQR